MCEFGLLILFHWLYVSSYTCTILSELLYLCSKFGIKKCEFSNLKCEFCAPSNQHFTRGSSQAIKKKEIIEGIQIRQEILKWYLFADDLCTMYQILWVDILHAWVHAQSLSHVQLFPTPWTIAYQTLLSMGFSRQESWSGLPFPFPGGLLDPGVEPSSLVLAGRLFTTEPPGKPKVFCILLPYLIFTELCGLGIFMPMVQLRRLRFKEGRQFL